MTSSKIFSQTGALPCVFGPAVELQVLPQQTQTSCKKEIYSGLRTVLVSVAEK